MIMLEQIIHVFYFVLAGFIGLLILRSFFKRTSRTGIIYDIVYAYCFIPFLLRILGIK